uniref:PPIase cyclophilin-type domain-containing protein n=1 Tax=Salix viminalis TaxID=40686 RepID=A0A6N2MQP5_SALVM
MYSPLTPQSPPPLLPHHHHHHHHHIPSLLSSTAITRRSFLLSTSLSTLSPPRPNLDTTITDRVFLDFSICSNYLRPDRTLSDNFSTLCADSVPLGRLVLGLYGHLVPLTVSNFKTMCTSYSYKNTLVHKIFPGQFFLAGRQGRREKGEVKVPQDLTRNIESVDSKAFELTHSRPGILSLCLSENDDEDDIKLDPEYRNVEFLITTGPGPCPQLDSKNIVFGVVLEVCMEVLWEFRGMGSSNCGSDDSEAVGANSVLDCGEISGEDGLPFPPPPPQIPGLPSVPSLPQAPRLPPTPTPPQIPGTLVNVIQCYTSVANVPGCVVEIKMKLCALIPLFPSLLKDGCGPSRGEPTAARATSKGSAGRLDVVTSIASIPTYKPSDRIRQFNDLAEFLGDERAQNARTIWNKPLKTVYISDCGELKVAKPSLTPSLP